MKVKDEFEYTPEGYLKAKEFLMNIGYWDQVSNHGLSTDGYSIVHEANSIHERLDLKKEPTTFEQLDKILNSEPIKEFDAMVVVDKKTCTHEKTYRFMGGKLVCTICGKVLSNGNIRA